MQGYLLWGDTVHIIEMQKRQSRSHVRQGPGRSMILDSWTIRHMTSGPVIYQAEIFSITLQSLKCKKDKESYITFKLNDPSFPSASRSHTRVRASTHSPPCIQTIISRNGLRILSQRESLRWFYIANSGLGMLVYRCPQPLILTSDTFQRLLPRCVSILQSCVDSHLLIRHFWQLLGLLFWQIIPSLLDGSLSIRLFKPWQCFYLLLVCLHLLDSIYYTLKLTSILKVSSHSSLLLNQRPKVRAFYVIR